MTDRHLPVPDPVLPLADDEAVTAERVGPKAATLARLRRAGFPVPDGFCVAADVYRAQLSAAGLEQAGGRVAQAAQPEAARLALEVRLGLHQAPLSAGLEAGLRVAYQRLSAELGPLVAVRSSALCEDMSVASFAGQLETILAVANEADLVSAVRACWASLWSSRAMRYAKARGADPARTAMAVLVQRLVPARMAGGVLSRTSDGHLVVTAAWGLGPAVAQGELVPDRYVLRREGPLLEGVEPGSKTHLLSCSAAGDLRWQAVASELVTAPCLREAEAVALARLALAAEALLGSAVEIEWALDDEGFWILQARPLVVVEPRRPGNRLWLGDLAL
ncbi:MAG: PEP/pyruvate-binding domain-containing protein, partial [Candidatus Methylomirabilia bacterium]